MGPRPERRSALATCWALARLSEALKACRFFNPEDSRMSVRVSSANLEWTKEGSIILLEKSPLTLKLLDSVIRRIVSDSPVFHAKAERENWSARTVGVANCPMDLSI